MFATRVLYVPSKARGGRRFQIILDRPWVRPRFGIGVFSKETAAAAVQQKNLQEIEDGVQARMEHAVCSENPRTYLNEDQEHSARDSNVRIRLVGE